MRTLVRALVLSGLLTAWLPALAQDSTQYIHPYLFLIGGTARLYNQVDRLQTQQHTTAPASLAGYELAPKFGYFFSPSYSIGAELQLGYARQENDNISSTGSFVRVRQEVFSLAALPQATFYLPVVERVYGFGQLGAGYTLGTRDAYQSDPASKLVQRHFSYSSQGPLVQLGAGVLYFVREILAIELQGAYRVSREDLSLTGETLQPSDLAPDPGRYIRQAFNLRLGFQVFLRIKHVTKKPAGEEKAIDKKERQEKKEGAGKK